MNNMKLNEKKKKNKSFPTPLWLGNFFSFTLASLEVYSSKK